MTSRLQYPLQQPAHHSVSLLLFCICLPLNMSEWPAPSFACSGPVPTGVSKERKRRVWSFIFMCPALTICPYLGVCFVWGASWGGLERNASFFRLVEKHWPCLCSCPTDMMLSLLCSHWSSDNFLCWDHSQHSNIRLQHSREAKAIGGGIKAQSLLSYLFQKFHCPFPTCPSHLPPN